MMLYTPTSKYDGHLVRGRITAIATREEMAENWDKVVAKWPDAPSRNSYVSDYKRIRVKIENRLGGGIFGQPFLPSYISADVGDIVEYVAMPGDSAHQYFESREVVARIVCKFDDSACTSTPDAQRRGIVDKIE
jgi:hypothetical protein